MGQDREYSAEEVEYALETVKFYRDEWERTEKENLSKDIDKKLESMESDRIYKEVNEALDTAEAEKRAEEATAHADG